jgi:hypothetical protein
MSMKNSNETIGNRTRDLPANRSLNDVPDNLYYERDFPQKPVTATYTKM